MDIPSTTVPMNRLEALQRLLDQLLAGHDVTLFTEDDGELALLDRAVERMAGLRSRVLRAAAVPPGGLSLSGLLAQVTGRPDLAAPDDEVLKRGFQALTVPDETCDRIVLLIGGAHSLQRAALRYIQFACGVGPNLRLVLAGKRGFLDRLNADEFADLRARLAAGPILTLTPAPPSIHDAPEVTARDEAELLPNLPLSGSSASTPYRSRRLVAWSGFGVGMAAFVALGIWIDRHGWQAAPPQQTALGARAPTAAEISPASPAETPSLSGAAPRATSGMSRFVPAEPDQARPIQEEASAPAAVAAQQTALVVQRPTAGEISSAAPGAIQSRDDAAAPRIASGAARSVPEAPAPQLPAIPEEASASAAASVPPRQTTLVAEPPMLAETSRDLASETQSPDGAGPRPASDANSAAEAPYPQSPAIQDEASAQPTASATLVSPSPTRADTSPAPASETQSPGRAASPTASGGTAVPETPRPQSLAIPDEVNAQDTALVGSLASVSLSEKATSVVPPIPTQTMAVVSASKQTETRPANPLPRQGSGRRSKPAPSRVAAAQVPATHARSPGEWEDLYAEQPLSWRSWPPPQATFNQSEKAVPRPYIGTYTTDANGVRRFRFGP